MKVFWTVQPLQALRWNVLWQANLWWGVSRSRKGPQSFLHTQDNIKRRQFDKSTSLAVHLVKHLPAMQETQVQSMNGEDPLEKEMATHSSILAWKIPWTEEPGKLQSTESQRIRHDLET